MEPAYSVDVETVGDVLVVHVPDGNKKPYSVGGKFFIREGSNSQQLSRDEIREFFFKENLIYWDQKFNIDFHPDKDSIHSFGSQIFLKALMRRMY